MRSPTLLLGLKIAAGISLLWAWSGCGEDAAVSVPDDTIAPTVVSTDPVADAKGVALDTTVRATFSETMDTDSIDATSFNVAGVTGSVDYANKVATFTPEVPLELGKEYTATLTPDVTDRAGNPIAAAFIWSFTTNALSLADAGPDADYSIGEPITLDGSGSGDPDDVSPITYAWTQLSGPTVSFDGTAEQPTLSGVPDLVATLEFQLVVSDVDGPSEPDVVRITILEDKDNAAWVSPDGDDANAGSRAAPLETIQAGIDAMAAAGQSGDVYVAEGTYEESIELVSGVSVYGSFNTTRWVREENTTTIDGVVTPARVRAEVAIFAADVSNITLDGLNVVSADGSVLGQSSMAIWLANAQGITIRSCDLRAGAGQPGRDAESVGPLAGRARDGGDGNNSGVCGVSSCCTAVSLCRGGGGGPGNGGAGGRAGTTIACDGESGAGNDAGDGVGGAFLSDNGGNGTSRAGQVAGAGPGGGSLGSVGGAGNHGPYVPAPGTAGNVGAQGGGGGGGRSVLGPALLCGATGGGGGEGGTGGNPGGGGDGGGGSFGIYAVLGSAVDVIDTTISTMGGGIGGAGTAGGDGQAGGNRGSGGNVVGEAISAGNGGNGGHGGQGGPGGGGGGGPSLGIFTDATSTVTSTNVSQGSPGIGPGGPGGGGPGNAGATGVAGLFAPKTF